MKRIANKSQYYKNISLSYVARIQRRAKVRNREYDLTPEYLNRLYLKQNKRCAFSGMEIGFDKESAARERNITASLDRIDSTKGYVKGNVQWVFKDFNKMKQSFDDVTFFQLCKEVAIHTQRNKKGTKVV